MAIIRKSQENKEVRFDFEINGMELFATAVDEERALEKIRTMLVKTIEEIDDELFGEEDEEKEVKPAKPPKAAPRSEERQTSSTAVDRYPGKKNDPGFQGGTKIVERV